MPTIATERQLKAEIARDGFCLLRAEELRLSDELRQEWLSLTIDYADLPADEFLPGGARYRYRRYGRFQLSPGSGQLRRLPHEEYFQSVDINRVTGGFIRKFAPMLDSAFENAFLRALIRFDFAQFPLDDAARAHDWEVQAHLIRIVAEAGAPGFPSPEGLHRDGAAFVTVHLAELVNAAGGQVSIYADDRQLLRAFHLERVLDSYLFNDASLWHEAAAIRPIDPRHRAIRSILTFDFHPMPPG